jgi:SAM-dependent methyltransferase
MMAVRTDSEGIETRWLLEMIGSFAGKRILEVGCGSGRLTWRYAEHAHSILGLDPNPDSIAAARANTPIHLRDKVAFLSQSILDYTAPPHIQYEVALLSWSLCCLPTADMLPALQKIHALQPVGGWLIDIHPRTVPRPLLVQIDQRAYEVAALVDTFMRAQYQRADNALEQAVAQQLYHLEAAAPFVFHVYVDTGAELLDYLRQNDTGLDCVCEPALDPALLRRVDEYLQLSGGEKRIVLQRPVMIRKYRAVEQQ